ncbi:MAG: 5'/3'-nucleotidase SurE [Myxococcota bacterium]
MPRPFLLASNDDGYDAPGLLAMVEAMRAWADVVVVATKHEQSGQSHAISLHRPLRHDVIGDAVHAIDGTPADCVYCALYREGLLPRRPDLVVSGMNHGPNLGSDVYYSGTVAAAREGALRGVPAIAFSMVGRGSIAPCAELASVLARRMLEAVRPAGQPPLLNVNFPKAAEGEVPFAGVRATRLGVRHYSEGVDVRRDPRGREYFWIGLPGSPEHSPLDGSDTDAIDEGYVSVTPLSLQATQGDHFGLASYVAGPRSQAAE